MTYLFVFLLMGAGTVASSGAPTQKQGVDQQSEVNPVNRKQAFRWLSSKREVRRDAAVSYLRGKGPEGLAFVLERRERTADQRDDRTERDQLNRSIDRIAGQKLGHVSGLFWFKDLDRALKYAKRTDQPVLSLRMFGRLDDTFS